MTEVSPTSTEWIDRVIHLLELGSSGVMVLVDRAHDSHAGYLARAMLERLGEFHEARSAAELRDTPAGAAVLLRLRDPSDVVALNIGRQVVRDNALRVVVWGTPEVMAVLPQQAFDFYDWISHRVECPPPRAFRWMVRTFEAASRAERPIWWQGPRDMLNLTVSEAWTARIVEVAASEYPPMLAALARPEDVVLVRVDGDDDAFRLRCGIAQSGRACRVVALARQRSSCGWGFWHLGREDADGPALIDCEDELMPMNGVRGYDDPVADDVRRMVRGEDVYSASVGVAPPAELRSVGIGDLIGPLLVSKVRGRSATPDIASWALLLFAKSDFEAADATNARQRIEADLWRSHRSGELDRVGIAEQAAREAVFDLASVWAGDAPAARDTIACIRVVQGYQSHGPRAGLSIGLGEQAHAGSGLRLQELARQIEGLVRPGSHPSRDDTPPLSDIPTLLTRVGTGEWSSLRHADFTRSDSMLAPPATDALAVIGWAADRSASRAATAGVGVFAHWLTYLLVDAGSPLDLATLLRARADIPVLVGDGESFWEGWLQVWVGKALARLGRRESARLALLDAEGILLRTTKNPQHPLILVARFERVWLDVVEKKTPVEELDRVLAELEAVLWPEHREVVAARALRRRV